jgi:hypothetical protein
MAAAAAPATPAGARALGTRFVHLHRSAAQARAVQRGDGAFRIFSLGELDEAETAGAGSHPVHDHARGLHFESGVGHPFAQGDIVDIKREVADIQLCHITGLLAVRFSNPLTEAKTEPGAAQSASPTGITQNGTPGM